MPPKKKIKQAAISFKPSRTTKFANKKKPSNANDLVDEISSESDEEEITQILNKINKQTPNVDNKPSASLGLKRKLNNDSSLATNRSKRVRFTKSFTKSTEDKDVPSSDSSPWIVKYAPKCSSDVAMHAKKLKEIKTALIDMDTTGASIARQLYRHRLLIISGQTSSSKTAVVTTLAKELGYGILEWHNHDKIDSGSGITESFEDFLTGAVFGNTSADDSKKLILVEDLPNISHYETKEMFNLALLQWINQPSLGSLPPLVLIITEYEVSEENRRYGRGSSVSDSVIVERILSRKILADPRVVRIKVQPINTTLMTKTLKHIVDEEHTLFSSLPISKSEIDASVKSLANENGDLRSAINSLEFWAKWQSTKSSKLQPITKESNLELFHAIGRIIHGSRKDKRGNPILSDSIVVESVLKDYGYNNRDGSISLAVFENYPGAHNSQMTIKSISSVAELLSETDILIPYNIPTIMSSICFEGVRYKLRHSQINTSLEKKFRPLVYPRDRKAYFKRQELSSEYDNYRTKYTKDHGIMNNKTDSILYDGYYEPFIHKYKRTQHQHQHLLINRLGGTIQSFSSIRPEQNEENDDDLRNEPVRTTKPEQPGLSLTFSDDEIEDSDNEL